MEYIEQPPKVVDKKKKRIKLAIILSSLFVVVAALVTGYAILSATVFVEYLNREYIRYSYYLYDEDNVGITIESITDSDDLPKNFRIPNKIDGIPVVRIGASAFAGLTQIESVQMPDTVTTIEESAFSGCTNLETFNVPSELVSVGVNAFSNTAWYNAQPEGLVTIGSSYIYEYKGTMPENSALAGTQSEYEQFVSSGDYGEVVPLYQYPYVCQGAFANQTNLVYVNYPDGESFSEVAAYLFQGCTNLETVYLGENITTIGSYAFDGCTSLEVFEFPPNTETIGDYAFRNTLIGGDLSFNSNLTSLGSGAFQYCVNIETFNFPSSLTSIPTYIFEGCESLYNVTFENDEYSLDSKITSVGASAFKGTALTEFTIPFAVRNVGANAFEGCEDLVTIRTLQLSDENLTSDNNLSRSYGLYTTGNQLFNNCSSFVSLVLVDEDNEDITSLGEVNFPSTLVSFGGTSTSSSGGTTSGADMFVGTQIRKVVIGSGMTFIASYFASNVSTLVEVDLSNAEALTTIAAAAFEGTGIVSIEIPNAVTTLGLYAFRNCTSLQQVNIPTSGSNFTILDQTFLGCTSLEEITIPSNVYEIGTRAFSGCINLRTVTFETNSSGSTSLRTINTYAFENCTSLTSITFPSTVRNIYAGAFQGCTSLVSVSLPVSSSTTAFTTLNSEVFSGTGLTSIELPSNVTTINSKAFENCSSLQEITLLNTSRVVTLSDVDAFDGTGISESSGTIYVPADLLDSYKSDSNWSTFESQIVAISE